MMLHLSVRTSLFTCIGLFSPKRGCPLDTLPGRIGCGKSAAAQFLRTSHSFVRPNCHNLSNPFVCINSVKFIDIVPTEKGSNPIIDQLSPLYQLNASVFLHSCTACIAGAAHVLPDTQCFPDRTVPDSYRLAAFRLAACSAWRHAHGH